MGAKMMPIDNSEAFLNMFVQTAGSDSWSENQCASVLIPSLISSAQQAINTLTISDRRLQEGEGRDITNT